MKAKFLVFLFFALLSSCSWKPYRIQSHFDKNNIPPVPDYSKVENWAALPEKKDSADAVPRKSNLINNQANAKVDVFFLHPTIFTGKPTNQYQWNADVNDEAMNKATIPVLFIVSSFYRFLTPSPSHHQPQSSDQSGTPLRHS